MISGQRFAKFIHVIRDSYNDDSFLSDEKTCRTWYEYFKDCNEWSFDKAVVRCVGECRRIPVVADIMTRYDEIEADRRKKAAEFSELWDFICDSYPGGSDYRRDGDCIAKIKRMTVDKTGGDYEKAYWIGQKVHRTVKEYASLHEGEDLPDFKTYFMGLE